MIPRRTDGDEFELLAPLWLARIAPARLEIECVSSTAEGIHKWNLSRVARDKESFAFVCLTARTYLLTCQYVFS